MTSKSKFNWKSWASYLALIGCMSIAVNWWQTRDAAVGSVAGFHGRLLDGSEFSMADYRGKPVLIHFWATWCPVCDLEKGSIQSISEDYTVVSVASWSDGVEPVTRYMRDNELTFPVLLDDSGDWAQTFRVRGVPASFIVDQQSMIVSSVSGYTTELGLRVRLWFAGREG